MNKLLIKKILRLLVPCSLVIFFVIQLIPVDRSNPPIKSEISAPPEIQLILRKACYDCHSNETTWPWYSNIAPVSWLLASDVQEGREELNFSDWASYNTTQQTKKLKEIWEEIEEEEMPPWSFILMHKNAALSPEERESLHKWVLDLTAK